LDAATSVAGAPLIRNRFLPTFSGLIATRRSISSEATFADLNGWRTDDQQPTRSASYLTACRWVR
jgi:hypothetical protein